MQLYTTNNPVKRNCLHIVHSKRSFLASQQKNVYFFVHVNGVMYSIAKTYIFDRNVCAGLKLIMHDSYTKDE